MLVLTNNYSHSVFVPVSDPQFSGVARNAGTPCRREWPQFSNTARLVLDEYCDYANAVLCANVACSSPCVITRQQEHLGEGERNTPRCERQYRTPNAKHQTRLARSKPTSSNKQRSNPKQPEHRKPQTTTISSKTSVIGLSSFFVRRPSSVVRRLSFVVGFQFVGLTVAVDHWTSAWTTCSPNQPTTKQFGVAAAAAAAAVCGQLVNLHVSAAPARDNSTDRK